MVLVCISASDYMDAEIHFVLVGVHMVGYGCVLMVPDVMGVIPKSLINGSA